MFNSEKVIDKILGKKVANNTLKKKKDKLLKQNQPIQRDLNEYIEGTLNDYNYWSGGLRFHLTKNVVNALRLGLRVMRQNNETDVVEKFNYHTEEFELV